MTRKLNILCGLAVVALLGSREVLAQGTPIEEAKRTLNEAITLDKEGKKQDAEEEFRRAITIHPQFAAAYEAYSLFLYAQKKYKLGLALMLKAQKAIPTRREFFAYRAMHLFRLERIPEAFTAFKVAEKAPEIAKRYEVQVVYAQCARLMADYPRVVRAVGYYLRFRPKALAPSDFIFQTQAAEALLRMGKQKQAGKLLREVRKKGPKRYRPSLLLLVEYLLRRKHCTVAGKAYQILTRKRRPASIELLPNLVDAYHCQNKTNDAYQIAGEYLQRRDDVLKKLLVNPTRSDVFGEQVNNVKNLVLLRGDLGMQLKKYGEALQAYQDALKLYPGEPKVVLRVAQAFFIQQQYDKVLAILDPELKKPDTMPPMIVLALRAAIRTKAPAVAVAHADRLLRIKPVHKDYYYYAGMAYATAGRFQQATELLEQGDVKDAKVRGELVRAYAYLGLRLLRKGEAEQALEKLTRALTHEPKEPALNRNVALLHIRKNDGKAALPHAMAALAPQPNDPAVNRVAARAYALSSQHKDALKHYKTAQQGFKGTEDERLVLDVEAALSEIEGGDSDEGMKILQQAKKTAAKDADLLAVVRRNTVRAHLARGSLFLDRNNPQKAWKELTAADTQAAALPEGERVVVQTMVALGALAAGKLVEAKKMIQKNKTSFVKAMNPPYNKIGFPLLMAYADSFAKQPRQVQSAAGRIAKLATRVPEPAKGVLEDLAGSIYMQLAGKLYRAGQAKAARAPLALAKQMAKKLTPEMRLNAAVVDYFAGDQDGSLRVMQASAPRLPVALCNLAVHYELKGELEKAYQYFQQCSARGVRNFPGLQTILEQKVAVFGKK